MNQKKRVVIELAISPSGTGVTGKGVRLRSRDCGIASIKSSLLSSINYEEGMCRALLFFKPAALSQ
jgi:hypothetical protein